MSEERDLARLWGPGLSGLQAHSTEGPREKERGGNNSIWTRICDGLGTNYLVLLVAAPGTPGKGP